MIKSILVKIILLLVGISCVVLAAGIYRFNFTNDDIYVDGKPVSVAMKENSRVMRMLFSFQTDKYWQIELPDSKLKIPLMELKEYNGHHFAVGEYQFGQERGVVSVDYPRITVLNFTYVQDEMIFAVPFSVSNQGSGVHWYIGLYNMNTKYGDIQQIDSLFVGDRIVINEMNTDEPFDVTSSIRLAYFSHGPAQSMADDPSVNTTKLIKVTPKGFVK
ncbi:hypothetical protein [Photobacterium sanguinicancri]|uniref:hypothetical protein n=1 Tax=Photobacterium sanguinicancri TaxID=875932 RepID=UPI001EFDE0D0|nr:hypothetical protein [Photobacterium sanguinicancri]